MEQQSYGDPRQMDVSHGYGAICVLHALDVGKLSRKACAKQISQKFAGVVGVAGACHNLLTRLSKDDTVQETAIQRAAATLREAANRKMKDSRSNIGVLTTEKANLTAAVAALGRLEAEFKGNAAGEGEQALRADRDKGDKVTRARAKVQGMQDKVEYFQAEVDRTEAEITGLMSRLASGDFTEEELQTAQVTVVRMAPQSKHLTDEDWKWALNGILIMALKKKDAGATLAYAEEVFSSAIETMGPRPGEIGSAVAARFRDEHRKFLWVMDILDQEDKGHIERNGNRLIQKGEPLFTILINMTSQATRREIQV